MDHLEICFKSAKENNVNYIGLLISMREFEKPEVIINPKENFDNKLEYYKKTYNDQLTHKYSKGIKIIGFTYGQSFAHIQWDLMGEQNV